MIKYSWIILVLIILLGSCKPPEEIVASGAHSVRFSADTILFDTVFSTVGTVTLRLKVYNDNSNAIKIGKIYIGGGPSSPFKVIINGLETSSANDVLLLGNDSLYVLIKLLIDPHNQNLPYIVTDSIVFTTGNLSQLVHLVAWGQDATFLNDSVLTGNVIWNPTKPFVIYKSLTVDCTAVLTINAGVRLYFGANANFMIKGKLITNGTFENQITLNTADLSKQNGVYPGQWSGIQISNSSVGNSLLWTTISNASTGVSIFKNNLSSNPDLTISHSIIKNMSGSAISGQTAYVNIDNSLLSNCAYNIVNFVSGGKGLWINNTFVCYSYDFFRSQPVLCLSDNSNGSNIQELSLAMANNVTWGDFVDEISMNITPNAGKFSITSCNNVLKTANSAIIDTTNNNIIFDFTPNRKLNIDTIHFVDTYSYNFRPDSISIVRHHGLIKAGYTDTDDLDGKPRNVPPDIGAYDYREN